MHCCGIEGTCGECRFIFLRSCQTLYRRGCTVLHVYSNELICFMLHILPRILYSQFFVSIINFNHSDLSSVCPLGPLSIWLLRLLSKYNYFDWSLRGNLIFCVFFRIFLSIVFIFILWEYIHARLCICIPRGAALMFSNGTGFPGVGVTGSCRWPAAGAGNLTQVLCRGCKNSHQLSHLPHLKWILTLLSLSYVS